MLRFGANLPIGTTNIFRSSLSATSQSVWRSLDRATTVVRSYAGNAGEKIRLSKFHKNLRSTAAGKSGEAVVKDVETVIFERPDMNKPMLRTWLLAGATVQVGTMGFLSAFCYTSLRDTMNPEEKAPVELRIMLGALFMGLAGGTLALANTWYGQVVYKMTMRPAVRQMRITTHNFFTGQWKNKVLELKDVSIPMLRKEIDVSKPPSALYLQVAGKRLHYNIDLRKPGYRMDWAALRRHMYPDM